MKVVVRDKKLYESNKEENVYKGYKNHKYQRTHPACPTYRPDQVSANTSSLSPPRKASHILRVGGFVTAIL